MTGDAPQPGETPRTEGNPWSFDPDAAWWRGDGDREQAEALAEVAARPRNPRRRSTPAPAADTPKPAADTRKPAADTRKPAADTRKPAADATRPVADTRKPAADTASPVADTRKPAADTASPVADAPKPAADATRPVADAPEPAADISEPAAPENPMLGETLDAHAAGAQDTADELQRREEPPVPGPDDVMVLPEPQPHRPTVPPDRGRTTGRDPAELDVKLSRIEESPFWLTEEERAAAGNPAPGTGTPAAEPADRPRGQGRTTARSPRRSAPGLVALVALALIAAFFSWVSAEPFWLAVGHGDRGTATVARCIGSGVTQRCTGSFAAAGGTYAAPKVTLLGVDPAHRAPGSTAAARMVDPHSRQAYVGNTGLLVHLRWVLGFVLVLLCGVGIAGLTGTRQLETARARRTAAVMSLAGPLVLLAGFLVASY